MLNQGKNIRRLWILLILRATRLCGFSTVSSSTLHRLVLFSNSLAPTNNVLPETAKVLKNDYGPYFPDYQVEIDRLIGLGLVDIVDMQWQSDDGRFLGKYRINGAGMEFVGNASAVLRSAAQAERAVSETVAAFADYQLDQEANAIKVDANYGLDTLQTGEIVDFGEWHNSRNYATEAAQFMLRTWEGGASIVELSSDDGGGVAPELLISSFEEVEMYAPTHVRKAAVYLYAQYIHSQLKESKSREVSYAW